MKIRSIALLIIFLTFNSNLRADTIFFDSENIKIEDNGDMIFATKGKARIPSNNLIIEGDKFIYNKKISELIILDDVKYFDKENSIYMEGQKLIYNEIENTILSKNETYIISENIYEINSSDVLYKRNKNKIFSDKLTIVNDNNENKFLFNEGLTIDLFKEIISSKKVTVTDKNYNKYFFENSKINLKINEIVGKEILIDFVDDFWWYPNVQKERIFIVVNRNVLRTTFLRNLA